MKDPITSGPKLPHQWAPVFLAILAVNGGDVTVACRDGYTTEAEVRKLREESSYFDVAYRIIMAEHGRRAEEVKQAGSEPVPSAEPEAQPEYPRSWMEPFLEVYVHCGSVAQAAAVFRVGSSSVFFQVDRHPRFAAAFAHAQAEVAERLWQRIKHRVPMGGLP